MLDLLLGAGERGLVLDLPVGGPAPQLVEQVGVALLAADRLDEQPPTVAGVDHERDRAARVADHRLEAVRLDPGRPQALADRRGRGPATRRANGQMDAGGHRPAERGAAEHVSGRCTPAYIRPSATSQTSHQAARRAGRGSQGPAAVASAAATATWPEG